MTRRDDDIDTEAVAHVVGQATTVTPEQRVMVVRHLRKMIADGERTVRNGQPVSLATMAEAADMIEALDLS